MLDIAEEKNGDFEDIAIETIKMKNIQKKRIKINRTSVCALGQLQEGVCVCVYLESLKERRGKDKNIWKTI